MNRLTLRHRLLMLTLFPSALIAVALVVYFTISGIAHPGRRTAPEGLATVRYLAPISEYGIIAGQIEPAHGLAQATVQDSGVRPPSSSTSAGARLPSAAGMLSAEELRQTPGTPAWWAKPISGSPSRRRSARWPKPTCCSILRPVAKADPPEIIGYVFVEFDR